MSLECLGLVLIWANASLLRWLGMADMWLSRLSDLREDMQEPLIMRISFSVSDTYPHPDSMYSNIASASCFQPSFKALETKGRTTSSHS